MVIKSSLAKMLAIFKKMHNLPMNIMQQQWRDEAPDVG